MCDTGVILPLEWRKSSDAGCRLQTVVWGTQIWRSGCQRNAHRARHEVSPIHRAMWDGIAIRGVGSLGEKEMEQNGTFLNDLERRASPGEAEAWPLTAICGLNKVISKCTRRNKITP